MRVPRFHPASQVLAASALVCVAFFLIAPRLAPLDFFRTKLIDGLYRARYAALAKERKTVPPSELPVVIAAVDDESLRILGERWPWRRGLYADFLERLEDAAPALVAFDLSFAVPSDRTEEDRRFEEAVRRNGRVVLSAYEGSGGAIVKPPARFEAAAAGTGILNALRDPDNTNRRFRAWWITAPDRRFPSFAAVVASVYKRERKLAASLPDKTLWARYDRKSEDFEIIPFWRFLEEEDAPRSARGRIVLVGATGEIFHDTYRTPVGVMPGVVIHANQVLTLLEGRFLGTPDGPLLRTGALALCAVLAWLFLKFRPGPSFAVFCAAFWLVGEGVKAAFVRRGLLVDPLGAEAAPVIAYAVSLVFRSARLIGENRGLLRQSMRDGLTDLYTYRYMESRLMTEFDRSRSGREVLSFVIFDLDHFKRLNDVYGHEKGNEILVAFARILKANTRGDDLVARYGGEEFCVLLPGRKRAEAFQIAERIRVSLEETPFKFGRKGESLPAEIHATVSAGVCSSESLEAFNGKELLRLADAALLTAKTQGRNRIQVHGEKS